MRGFGVESWYRLRAAQTVANDTVDDFGVCYSRNTGLNHLLQPL